MKHWIGDLLGVIFPNICEVCGRPLVHGEDVLCLHCFAGIPKTGIADNGFNEIHRRLASTSFQIEKAASWFHYVRDTDYARLLQTAKYGNRPLMARKFGRLYASELKISGFFDGITAIVPVPLSTLKRLKRGFNQSEEIARGIADVTGIKVENPLRVRHHSSQTKRSSYERWLNAQDIYSVSRKADLQSDHILLVDDVITSGATMVACLTALHEAFPLATLSVLSIALTES